MGRVLRLVALAIVVIAVVVLAAACSLAAILRDEGERDEEERDSFYNLPAPLPGHPPAWTLVWEIGTVAQPPPAGAGAPRA